MGKTENRDFQEMRRLAQSVAFCRDMRQMRNNRHEPLLRNGKVSADLLLDFLNGYNEFINHTPKPFSPTKDSTMKM
jgi:hypothetical protein